MSTGGTPRRPKKSQTGFFGAIIHFLSTPARWWSQRSERARVRRQRERAENIPQMSFVQRLLATLTFPFVALGEMTGGLFQFLGTYFTSRNGLFLLQGLPAVLIFAGTIALGILSVSGKDDDLVAHYKTEGEKAVKEAKKIENPQDPKFKSMIERARLCDERWMMLRPNDNEAKFSHAIASYETKDPIEQEVALNEMRQLAPHDRPGGFESAHKWLASFYLEQMRAASDTATQRRARELAEVHLMRVLIIDKDDYNAHRELAQLYMGQYRFDKAEKHLLVAAQLDQGANADLAKLYALTNQKEKADSRGQVALNYYQSILDRDPDNLDIRLVIAELYVILKNYTKAVEILEDGIKLKRDDRINKKVAAILLTAMLEIPPENFEERLKYFDRAMAVDPRNEAAFQYIVFYLRQNNPVAQLAQDRIDKALAMYDSPTLHLLLSEHYLREGKPDLARKHLEAVLRIQPEMLAAMNNLANVYAMMKPPDYNRALEIINTCLQYANEKKMGDDGLAFFLDTRGQIYVLRRQWREAMEDLERAIAYGMHNNLQSQTALLRCYQELNKKDLADEQIRLIAKMKEIQASKEGGAAAPPK